MYNGISHYLWLILGFLILVCELYVPYKKRVFLSLSFSSFVICFLSFLLSDLFLESVIFILTSVFFYSKSIVISAFCIRKDVICDTICLDDIKEASYGRVYCMGKTYIIKNDSGKILKKGEVARFERSYLEGESLVP